MLPKEDTLERLWGNYRARCIAVEGSGKIRIKVYGLHTNIDDNLLPVAEPALDIFGAGDGTGMASVPQIGTDVWVFFDGGNPFSPVYFAKATTASEFATLASEAESKIIIPSDRCIKIEVGGSTIQVCDSTIIIKGQTILLN